MDTNEKRKFNILCAWMERRDKHLLHAFYHALHNTVFPGKTHRGEYNMIWAIESSDADDWHKAAQLVSRLAGQWPRSHCGILCDVATFFREAA